MNSDPSDLPGLLAGFLAGDPNAREALPRRIDAPIRRITKRLSPHDFPRRGLVDDVVSRTWELLLRRPEGSFDPTRGNALSYVETIVRTAVRDIRNQHRVPVGRPRDYTPNETNARPCPPRPRTHTLDSTVEFRDALERQLGHGNPLHAAAMLVALDDTTMTLAATAVGVTRFSLSRRLAANLERDQLTAA